LSVSPRVNSHVSPQFVLLLGKLPPALHGRLQFSLPAPLCGSPALHLLVRGRSATHGCPRFSRHSRACEMQCLPSRTAECSSPVLCPTLLLLDPPVPRVFTSLRSPAVRSSRLLAIESASRLPPACGLQFFPLPGVGCSSRPRLLLTASPLQLFTTPPAPSCCCQWLASRRQALRSAASPVLPCC